MMDLYKDVQTIDLGSEIESLQNRNSQLETHIKCLEKDIETLCKTITEMKQTQINLANNISELFKTAKAEIERKDRIISELRSELDDLKFRRKRNNNQEMHERKRSRERSSEDCQIVEAKKQKIDEDVEIIDWSNKSSNRDELKRSRSRESKEDTIQNDTVKNIRSKDSEKSSKNSRSRSREFDRLHLKNSRSRSKSPVISNRKNFYRNPFYSSRRPGNFQGKCFNDPRINRFDRYRNNYYDNQKRTGFYDGDEKFDQIRDKNREEFNKNNEKLDTNHEKRDTKQHKDTHHQNHDKLNRKNENNKEKSPADKKSELNTKRRNNSESETTSKNNKDKPKKQDKDKTDKKSNSKSAEKCKTDIKSTDKIKSDILKAKQVDLFGFESSDTLLNSPSKEITDLKTNSDLDKKENVLTNDDTLDLEMQYEKLQREIKKIDENEERYKQYCISGDISKYKIPKKENNDILQFKKIKKASTSDEKSIKTKFKVNKVKSPTGKKQNDLKKSDNLDTKIRKTSITEEKPTELKNESKEIIAKNNKTDNAKKPNQNLSKSSNQKIVPKPENSKLLSEDKLRKSNEKIIDDKKSKSDIENPEKPKPKKLTLQEYNNKNSKITKNIENKNTESLISNSNQPKDEIPKKTVPNTTKVKQKSLDMISLTSPTKSNQRKRKSSDSRKRSLSKSDKEDQSEKLTTKSLDNLKTILSDDKANHPTTNKVELNSCGVTHDGEIPTLHLDDQNYIPVVTNFDNTRDRCNFMNLLDGEAKAEENIPVEISQPLSDKSSPGRLTFTNCLSKITSTPKPMEIIVSADPKIVEKTEKSPIQNGGDSLASDSSSKKENLSVTPSKLYNLKRGRVVLSFRN